MVVVTENSLETVVFAADDVLNRNTDFFEKDMSCASGR